MGEAGSIDARCLEYERLITDLRHDLDMFKNSIEEREKLKDQIGKKVDWKAVISAAGLATVLGGGLASLFLSDALDPLENDGLQYANRLTILERDLAVQVERSEAAEATSVQATEKLVEQLRASLGKAFEETASLRGKLDELEEEATFFVQQDRFDDKLESIAAERGRAIEAARNQLSENIERIGNDEAETQIKLDKLEADLAGTLGREDFEAGLETIRHQREQDLEFSNSQREDDRAFAEKQREQDQAALGRIVELRITKFIDDVVDRVVKLEDIVFGPAWKAIFKSGGDAHS